MTTPYILITSCAEFDTEKVIKDILQTETLPERKIVIENVVGYDWQISTKYYTADVLLCSTKERTIGDRNFAESVDAFIVYFNADEESSFELVKAWSPYLEQIDPEIKMLVCDRCTENHKVNRLKAQTWCVDNSFELVELNPEVESDSDVEDDFEETTGIKRIVQALHAHTWSNLEMKENPVHHSPYLRQLMQEEFHSRVQISSDKTDTTSENDTNNSSEKQSDVCKNKSISNKATVTANYDIKSQIPENKPGCGNKRTADGVDSGIDCTGDAKISGSDTNIPKSSENKQTVKDVKQPSKEERLDDLLQDTDMSLFESLGAEDPGGESFEKLFERFGRMKERASHLPPEERKKYAEQVAVAFWRAIGGDEDEIGNLSDSD